MRLRVRSLALLNGLSIWRCRELWCRSQTWLRSGIAVAVAVADSRSSDSTPSLGTSICRGCGQKRKKKNTPKKYDMYRDESEEYMRRNDYVMLQWQTSPKSQFVYKIKNQTGYMSIKVCCGFLRHLHSRTFAERLATVENCSIHSRRSSHLRLFKFSVDTSG